MRRAICNGSSVTKNGMSPGSSNATGSCAPRRWPRKGAYGALMPVKSPRKAKNRWTWPGSTAELWARRPIANRACSSVMPVPKAMPCWTPVSTCPSVGLSKTMRSATRNVAVVLRLVLPEYPEHTETSLGFPYPNQHQLQRLGHWTSNATLLAPQQPAVTAKIRIAATPVLSVASSYSIFFLILFILASAA